MTSCPPAVQIHERMQEVYIYDSKSKSWKQELQKGHKSPREFEYIYIWCCYVFIYLENHMEWSKLVNFISDTLPFDILRKVLILWEECDEVLTGTWIFTLLQMYYILSKISIIQIFAIMQKSVAHSLF